MAIETIKWVKGCARIIDQTRLPQQLQYINCRDVKTMWHAIKRLSVRGAPAIGVAGAFGVLLGIKEFRGKSVEAFARHIHKVCDYLATSRPTAVNLFTMIDRMRAVVNAYQGDDVKTLIAHMHAAANEIYEEDRRVCRAMGDHGATLIKNGMRALTVCNAGALATVDYGTALGVFYSAKAKGKKFTVTSLETRPLLQGARLTCWELMREGIDTTLICDNMAATLMAQGKIDIIFAGADRIAANGDAANKIGTYMLAVLAKYHKVPFYIVAPRSTFDLKIKTGKSIPIEERSSQEVTHLAGHPTAAQGVKVYNPAFDVTPAKLIAGIVTEYGIIDPVNQSNVLKTLSQRT